MFLEVQISFMVFISIPMNGSTSFSKNPNFCVYNPTSINPMNTKLKISGHDIKFLFSPLKTALKTDFIGFGLPPIFF